MERVYYTEDLFIDKVLKSNTDIRSIGFGNFLCDDDEGRWIAVIN